LCNVAAKGALGSWGDLISKNAKGGGMAKKVVTEKAWWNCLDPKWKKGGAASVIDCWSYDILQSLSETKYQY